MQGVDTRADFPETVSVGTKVDVEIWLGTVSLRKSGDRNTKFIDYRRMKDEDDIFKTYYIVDKIDANSPAMKTCIHIHFDSFIGRALLGHKVGDVVDVCVGGLSLSEQKTGQRSGNDLRIKILSVLWI